MTEPKKLKTPLTPERLRELRGLWPEDAERQGVQDARAICATCSHELCFLHWVEEERRFPGSNDSRAVSDDPVERWLYGYLGHLTEYFFSNYERLNPDTTEIHGLSQKDRECIRGYIAEMTEYWDSSRKDQPVPKCPICGWHHDSDMTNVWSENIKPFEFPSGGVHNNILRAIHSAMASGRKSISRSNLPQCENNELYEVFRSTKADAYRHLISTRNRMVRIKSPEECVPKLVPKKSRKSPKSPRNAKKR